MLHRFNLSIIFLALFSLLFPFAANAQAGRIDSLKEALTTAKNDTVKIYLRNELCRGYAYTKPDTSLILLRESFEIAAGKDFRGLMSITQMLTGITYNNLGNRDSAELYFKRAIENAHKYKRTFIEASSYLGLGTCYNFWRKQDKALQNYMTSYDLFRSMGDSVKLASAALGLGNVYSDLNDVNKSKEYFTIALNSATSRNDTKFMAKCYNNLGNLFQKNKKYEQALEYYSKSMDIKKLMNDEHGIANTYLNFGNIYTLTRKIDLAILFYGKAMDLYVKLGDTAEYMHALTYTAEGLLGENKTKEALSNLKKAEGICIRNHYYADLAGVYGALTKVYILKSDTANARMSLENYTAIKDSILTQDMQRRIAEMTAQFDNDKQRQELLLKEAELAASKKISVAYIIATAVVSIILVLLLLVIMKLRKANKLLQENARQNQKTNRS